jgi:Anti-sigma-K factor rskA/Putative zinc-finger
MNDHQHIQSLLAPYALDALDDAERLMVAEHIESCESCADEVIELLDTASVVALGEAEAAPDSLWSKIATGMQADAATLAPSLKPVPAPTIEPIASVISMASHRAERHARIRPWVAALAGAAAALLIAIPLTRSLSGSPKSDAPNLVTLMASQAEATGSRTLPLVSTDEAASPIGEVVLTTNGAGFIRLDSAEPLPDGKTYQLWTVVDGKPVSAGLLGQKPTLAAFVVSSNAQAVALSVEDAVGATAPSADPIAIAAIA